MKMKNKIQIHKLNQIITKLILMVVELNPFMGG